MINLGFFLRYFVNRAPADLYDATGNVSSAASDAVSKLAADTHQHHQQPRQRVFLLSGLQQQVCVDVRCTVRLDLHLLYDLH